MARKLGLDDEIISLDNGDDNDKPITITLPPLVQRMMALTGESAAAWEERCKRFKESTATDDDHRVHRMAVEALQAGRALPPEAKRLPTKPPATPTFHADEPDRAHAAIAMGIPALIAESIVAKRYELSESIRQTRRVEQREMNTIVLAGERGHGKSYAAALWLFHGQHTIPHVLRKLVKPRKFVASDELDVLDKYEQNDLGMASALVIDDAGVENDFLSERVALLLVRRYRNGLQTVVTTNLNRVDFLKRYGGRVASRMQEIGEVVIVGTDPDKSFRARNREEMSDATVK